MFWAVTHLSRAWQRCWFYCPAEVIPSHQPGQVKPHPFLEAKSVSHPSGEPGELVWDSPCMVWWENGCPERWRGVGSCSQGLCLAHMVAQHNYNSCRTQQKLWVLQTSTPPLTHLSQKSISSVEVMIKAEQLHTQNREDLSADRLESDTNDHHELVTKGALAVPGCKGRGSSKHYFHKWNSIWKGMYNFSN